MSTPVKELHVAKTGYEIRLELLSLATKIVQFEHAHNLRTTASVSDVLAEAEKLHEFVNKKPGNR